MTPKVDLTPRQRTLLDKLVELYQQEHLPVHYGTVAKRLGIRNTTAYQLLKILEREGYVTCQYVLSGTAGPGRSSVVFVPTPRAESIARRLPGLPVIDVEWESLRDQILSRLGQGELVEKALVDEIMERLSESQQPLVYCTEVLTALILNIGHEMRARLPQYELMRQLANARPSVPSQLGMLPGFALGLSQFGSALRLSDRLIPFSQTCQDRLREMDEASCALLSEFLRQVMTRCTA